MDKTPEQIVADLANKMAEYEKAVSEKADSKAVDALKKEVEQLKEAKLEAEINEKWEKKWADWKELMSKQIDKANSKEAPKGFASKLREQLEAKKEEIKSFHRNSKPIEIETKVADVITFGNITNREILGSELLPGYVDIQKRQPFIMDLVSVGTTSKKTIHWVEKTNPDPGVAGMTAENTPKTQGDFDFIERKKDLEKVTYYIKVSEEMVEDIDFMLSSINDEIRTEIMLKADEQVLEGDGVSPNLQGILDYAVPFNAGTLAGTVPNANNFDVIRAAVAQIQAANFTPTVVVVNPADAAQMELTKDNDGAYVMPPFANVGGTVISGMRVIVNNGIAAGTFLVMDARRSKVFIRNTFRLEIGRDGNDFINNRWTILGEMRLTHYIPTNHVNAFVTGDFTTAIAALLQAPVE